MKFFVNSAHLIFLTLFFFSLVFYLERVAFIDSSYHLFKLINAESLTFEAGRYGAFLTKWPALLMIKLGASLKIVMLVFSSWFIVWYYLIFLFITYVLNNKTVGIALALSLVTGYGDTFFHCVTETHQALAYCLLFYSWFSNPLKLNFAIQLVIGLVIIILAFLSHPISVLVILVLLGFHLVKDNNYKQISNYLFLILLVIIVSLKLIFTDGNSYEGQFFDIKDLAHSFKDRMFNWVFYFRNIYFLYLTSSVAILVIGVNAIKRKTLPFIYTFLSSIVLLFLLMLIYKGGANVMKERAILPFCTVVILFLIELLLHSNAEKLLAKGSVVIGSLIGIAVIFTFHFSHSERINKYQNAFLSKPLNQTKKIIIPSKILNNKTQVITWSIPYETLLLSSVEGKEYSKTIYPLRGDELNSIDVNENTLMLGAPFYLKHNASELNKNYFILDDCSYASLESLPE